MRATSTWEVAGIVSVNESGSLWWDLVGILNNEKRKEQDYMTCS